MTNTTRRESIFLEVLFCLNNALVNVENVNTHRRGKLGSVADLTFVMSAKSIC